jgi:ethanolamine utilization protein EutN
LTVHRRALTLAAMYLGIVTGTVVAARKAAGLEGKKLLLVQPVDEHGAAVGDVQVAVDTVQAGVGDRVTLVGSREAALACDPWFVPVDAAIVGIVDGIGLPAKVAP